MEYFDVVDAAGRPTGEAVSRAEAHARGTRHRTAHIWLTRVQDGRTEVLLQKRSRDKDSFPGWYDTSAAGHIQAGEEPLPSALRELREELGIPARPEQLVYAGRFRIRYEKEFHGRPFRDNEVAFVYVYRGPVDAGALKLQAKEVERVDWFDLEAVYAACRRREEARRAGWEQAEPDGEDRFCVYLEGLDVLKSFLARTARG